MTPPKTQPVRLTSRRAAEVLAELERANGRIDELARRLDEQERHGIALVRAIATAAVNLAPRRPPTPTGGTPS